MEPLKLAAETVLMIWSRIALKSEARAARDTVFSEASAAASALVFSWFRRSEMVEPAEFATSTVDWARWSESLTASSEEMSEREFCAMA